MSFSYEQLVALLHARSRRLDREAEHDYDKLRLLLAAWGVNLPPYRRAKPKPMTAAEVNRQLQAMERRGIQVSYVRK